MALSKIDVANMLTGATPVANGGTALTSGFVNGGGVTVADTWRVNTSFDGTANPIASNWEQQDTAGMGTVGSAMTQSSGIFTFPSTGVYQIVYIAYMDNNTDSRYNSIQIYATVNNSSYTHMAENSQFLQETSGTVAYSSAICQTFFDVTDTTQCKVRFHFVPQN